MDVKITKDLDKLVRWARKNGVTSLKNGDFSIELAPSALFPESEYKKKKAIDNDPIITESTYTEEDALFWSSTSIPEEKETH